MKMLLCRYLLAMTLAISIVVSPIALAKPSFFQKETPENDLAELEAMFSGKHSDAGGSREIVQFYGGQARPIEPNITAGTSYDVPYQDFFRDNTIFGDFLGLFEENLTPLQINSTWRETYLDSIAVESPSAKGRMTEPWRTHLLKPILIDEPQF